MINFRYYVLKCIMLRHPDIGNTTPFLSSVGPKSCFLILRIVAATFLSFFAECVLRFMEGTGVTLLSEFGLKKQQLWSQYLVYVGGPKCWCHFYPVSDKFNFFLLSIPEKDLWRIFSEELIGIRPLKWLFLSPTVDQFFL